ncbi:MAG: lipoprotein insertase outer membrane protein LolB [Chromatiales bacterium]|nr:lipoprotein insertase outer membrane protein LolB [Chromatiales bacterium]
MSSTPSPKIAGILLTALLLGLSGCATQPVPPEPLPQKQITTLTKHQQQLKGLQNWQIKGRLVLSYNGDSWNASIHWQNHPDRYDIQLYLPLGQGSMQLNGDQNGATLNTSDGEHFTAKNGENLFYQQFGFTFPIGALHEWVTGRPDMRASASNNWQQQVDKDGQMVSLNQNNWNLRLPSYQKVTTVSSNATHDAAKILSLPRKIFLRQNGKSIRLVIQQWQLND